ncbi:MAG: aspartate carbamoyltransferase catalytic subunit [Candidatus Hydrogenedens sp.]
MASDSTDIKAGTILFNEKIIKDLIHLLAQQIVNDNDVEELAFIGILRRGYPLAKRIAEEIFKICKVLPPVGAVSTTLFRDDLRIGRGVVQSHGTTHFSFDINQRTIILVDDVLAAGRTIRAAMDEIMYYGRPKKVLLACLIDRGGREIPIQPSYCAWKPTLEAIPQNLWISVLLKETDGKDMVIIEEQKSKAETPLQEVSTKEPVFSADHPVLKIWKHKDLLGLQFLSKDEIVSILDMVPPFLEVMARSTGIKKVPLLQGRVVVHWFHEPSTRTFASFDLAAKRLSADTLSISAASSSEKKGETLHDTLYNIEAMKTDILVVRHRYSGVPKLLADSHPSHVINAGDGQHEHPTQGLLDVFTMRQFYRNHKRDMNIGLEGAKVSIIGDITHSRVARSNIWALLKLGAQITLCGPQTLLPKSFEKLGVRITTHLKEALLDADIIYSLRIQMERQTKGLFPSIREYVRLYRIDRDTIRYAPEHAIVMHPGPINRDIELATEIADSPRSRILQQVSHGVAVRMAVMHLLANSQYNQNGV